MKHHFLLAPAARKLFTILALLSASIFGWAAPATYTGAGFSGAINGYTYDIVYSITYDDDHHLTFNVTLDGTFKETAGFVFEVWSSDLSSGNFKSFVHGEGNAWSVTDDAKDYSSMEGQSLNQLRLRMASSVGGTDQLYMSDYTVGLSGSAAIEGPTSRATTPSTSADKTRAITSWYYGKGCNFADWGGGTSAQNTRFGKKISCNRADGNGWGGLVDFGDLDCSGMDKLHMDIWVENNSSFRITPIHYGYGQEYRNTLNLTGGQWNSIELDLNATNFVSDGSQGAPDDYWDVINQFKFDLLANGQMFWIDNFYFYSDQEPVFTSISITAAALCHIGNSIALSIETLDQFGQHIDADYTCSVAPATAGTIVGTTYTASTVGNVTITVTSGLISNTLSIYNYDGSNLALNKSCEAGYEDGNPAEVAAKANDGDEGSLWVTYADRPATEEWWYVDLEEIYDLSAIAISWGNDYSTNYILQVRTDAPSAGDKADDEAWTTIATVTDAARNSTKVSTLTGTGRYVRFRSINRSSNCIRLREFQVFGTEAASPTKSVSATPNNASYGSATVKQNGVAVTEVETGSEVTFSAVANDGYLFTGWSNGESRATFTTTVSSNLNITANFRELGNIYCNTEMTKNGHTAYVTMKRSGENEYQLIIRSNEELVNFGGTVLYKPNNIQVQDLRNNGVLSTGNHTLTATVTSDKPLYFGTPLYVVFGGGVNEITYDALTNIEYDAECDDDVPVTSISIASSAVVAIDGTTTLTPTFAPVYATNQSVTWSSDNEAIATVSSSGVVTGVSAGTAHITATSVDGGRTAQCTVTVAASQIYWNNGRDANNDVSIAYSIEYNGNRTLTYTIEVAHEKSGLWLQVNDGDWHTAPSIGDNKYSFTTETTYTNETINGFFYMPFSGGAARVDYSYTVGSVSAEVLVPIYLNDAVEDISAKLTSNNGKTRDVTISRPMTANDDAFKTICFPFSMTQEQIALTFGDCEILVLSEARMKSADEMFIRFAPVSSIVAGKPYLITLLGDNKAALDFSGVTINSSTANNEIKISAGDDHYISMIGTFTPTQISDEDDYYLDIDNYLHSSKAYYDYAGAEVSISAFRCFFRFSGFPAGQAPARVRIVRQFDEATDIGEIAAPAAATKQFIDGQIVIIRDGVRYSVTGLKVE